MKLAVIGASKGQYSLCLKARELGMETFCFAWDKNAVCKTIVDHFYPIDIFDTERIVDICREQGIQGVVSNASDITAEVQAKVSDTLGLNGTPYHVFRSLRDKYYIRRCLDKVEGLNQPRYYKYQGNDSQIYPCVVKPCVGSSKYGITYVDSPKNFRKAIDYAKKVDCNDILIEQFVGGKEISVETISFHGQHEIAQITDKDTCMPPHFAETGHHQPADLPKDLSCRIKKIVPAILTVIGFTNGVSHIEMKYTESEIFVIEVNPRGGGGYVSQVLTYLSSGIDYLAAIIKVALNTFQGVQSLKDKNESFSGVYFLCKQSEQNLPLFTKTTDEAWIVEKKMTSNQITESITNNDRSTYLIYQSDHKIGAITKHVFSLKDFNLGKQMFIDFMRYIETKGRTGFRGGTLDKMWKENSVLAYFEADKIISCMVMNEKTNQDFALPCVSNQVFEEMRNAKKVFETSYM